LASPLNELDKKDVPFVWGHKQQHAFDEIKVCLTQAPVLALPNFDKTFELKCDASGVRISVVLLQEDHLFLTLVRNSMDLFIIFPPMTRSFMHM